MNSGIYLLEFECGDNYVGQARDFNKRWQQHWNNLLKGKHTKLLQDAYYKSGSVLPKAKALIECHPHHLDLYETHAIHYLKPTLNHQVPPPLTPEETKWMEQLYNTGNAHNSIPQLVQAVWQGNQVELELQALRGKWEDKVALEMAALDGYDELVSDLGMLRDRLDGTRRELVKLQGWRDRVLNLNWWQRLWARWDVKGGLAPKHL